MNETFRHRRFQVTVTRSFTQFSIGFAKNAIFIGDILGVLPSIHICTQACVCIYIFIIKLVFLPSHSTFFKEASQLLVQTPPFWNDGLMER